MTLVHAQFSNGVLLYHSSRQWFGLCPSCLYFWRTWNWLKLCCFVFLAQRIDIAFRELSFLCQLGWHPTFAGLWFPSGLAVILIWSSVWEVLFTALNFSATLSLSKPWLSSSPVSTLSHFPLPLWAHGNFKLPLMSLSPWQSLLGAILDSHST